PRRAEIGIPAGLRQHLREVFGEEFRVGLIGFELNKRPQFRLADGHISRPQAADLPHDKATPADLRAGPKTRRAPCPLNAGPPPWDRPRWRWRPPGRRRCGPRTSVWRWRPGNRSAQGVPPSRGLHRIAGENGEPPLVEAAVDRARLAGFPFSCDPVVGRLLA